jgi:hypothetical protein
MIKEPRSAANKTRTQRVDKNIIMSVAVMVVMQCANIGHSRRANLLCFHVVLWRPINNMT